ncbi:MULTISPECIES: DNA starvation/stationary phase protection protein Dps [Idiomarina]|jgi:starvation-inducible DNA-binding protein|uniref:DNA starvation/stationary phase protection protein Dps n=1 Tax=Idiomarina abyssalis TaxID=86102 RepID=A0A8I1KHK4_9GAMM|nr:MULTISPECIES: DNA starvation/stationary phase protection protein Dps [Idiomarina]KPD22441.1 DNA polymerase sliding clamp subunit [Idiomarina abyssalis]MAO67827.1 DNA starvation/stationary phase protection protein Dps [Idiomarina sp.]MBF79300.1 DNA starvation/stationary phase protection protein Dps [Idiomarina sp.]MBH94768.1 DNA starvation/stationary phase protection protein Dps [Idiomarina sp.]MBJ7266331.1 DNA starvation/stationary phase protection protein Dps [Idiomarina abyssalis]|tara:strand:+ start:613 stop:1134 length:522 start_codon:yes stop_codon:yes gene_type:complete
MSSNNASQVADFTAPGMNSESADKVIAILDDRLVALLDLQLTLKHVHWNVVGPNFIGVHEMLDPQVDAVREMTDTIAERIATLGGVPVGTPKAIAERRRWEDYSLGKGLVAEHLVALDKVYNGVNGDHREAMETLAELDPVSEDMLTGQLAELEQFQWFVRAHIESSSGELKS